MTDGDLPLVAGRLYGVRRWNVVAGRSGPVLSGYGIGDGWERGGRPTRARCLARGVHEAPAGDCGCGLYALHPTPSNCQRLWAETERGDGGHVVGIAEAWGEVELHASGFRAQYARPHALVAFGRAAPAQREQLRLLAAAYRCGLLELRTGGTLHRYCTRHQLGMQPDAVRRLVGSAPPRERFTGVRARLRRARRRLGRVGETVGDLVSLALFLGGCYLAYVLAAGFVAGFEEERYPPVDAPRWLQVREQRLVDLGDGSVAYLALVENESRQTAALGVYPLGGFDDRDGDRLGGPDGRFGVELRPNIGPGQTGVVGDVIEEPPFAAEEVARHRLRIVAARTVRVSAAPARLGAARFDRGRCLVMARVDAAREFTAVDIALVTRDRRGRIHGLAIRPVGPLRRGRSEQVVERTDPYECRRGPGRVEAYPAPAAWQVRALAADARRERLDR